MKRQFSSTILGASLFTCCLLTNGLALHAQERVRALGGAPPPGSPKFTFRAGGGGGGFGLVVINGLDIGTILLKTCDLDQSENVTPAELKDVAAACFKLWDTNTDGSVGGNELSAGLNELFPAPPSGATRGMRVLNGVAVEIPPDQLPTPGAQVARTILAGADANKDSALTFDEISAFLLGQSFSQWDQDGNGSLNAHELNVAFCQLAKPD